MDLKRIETLLNVLLRRRENSPEFVEELNDYASDLKDGTLTQSDSDYIEALAKRLNIFLKGEGNTQVYKIVADDHFMENSGVFFVEMMKSMTKQQGASRRQIHDWGVIEIWLDCQSRELNKRDKEKIGNAWKAYLARGVAPSVELQSAFDYFSKQYMDEGYSCEDNKPPAEIMKVFDRLLASDAATRETKARGKTEENEVAPEILNAVFSLIENDLENVKKGEHPETRLIPHIAIKRDIIEKAYLNDLDIVIRKIDQSNILEEEKQIEIQNHTKDVEGIIYNLRRIRHQELEDLFDDMRDKRDDFSELEEIVRSEKPRYKIVDPL